MKRTCLQKDTNTDEQITCDPDSYRDHRVRKWTKETKHNRQLISNFNNLHR